MALDTNFMMFVLLVHVTSCEGKIQPFGDAYTMSVSDNAELKCVSDATPKPRNMQWFKNGKQIFNTPGQYDFKSDPETLEVITIDEIDVGEYTCLDKDNGDTNKVYLHAPARSANGKNIIKNQGQTFTIDCHAWGHPPPTVRWYKDGKLIAANNSHYVFEDGPTVQNGVVLKNGRLRIVKSKSSDTGKYKCIAANQWTSDEPQASTSVLVQSPAAYIGPAIGILALLILLGVGLGLFFYFRNKYKKDEKKRKNKWKKMEAERNKQMAQGYTAKA